MTDAQRVDDVLASVIAEINATLPLDRKLGLREDTVLLGPGGLDSIGLVNLVVAVEQGLQDAFDRTLVLASEKAMSRRTSPFRTVGALKAYIQELLQEAAA